MPVVESARPKGTWYRFAGWLVRNLFFRNMGGLTVTGRENVPSTGPVLITSVHLSHLDPPLLGSVCPRQLRFMAKEELFKNPLLSALIRSLGAFPIRRGESDRAAIKLTLQWLEDNGTVLMFPEGQRGDGTTMGVFQSGAAMLAKRSGATVVPVGICGTHKILPRGGKGVRRAPVTVVFGRPFTYKETAVLDDDKQDRAAFNMELERRILLACADAGLTLRTADGELDQTTSHPIRTLS